MKLEIIATSLESALAAEDAGADRLELCIKLHNGGVSPGKELVNQVTKRCQIPVFVMVRPRSGDFVYNHQEYLQMKSEINFIKTTDAAGVVLGMLDKEGNVDIERLTELVSLSRPMSVTFHRAFDHVKDAAKALEDVITTGSDRILTSGLKDSAWEGRETIAGLVRQSKGRLKILAGSGINSLNANELIKFTGVEEIHASATVDGQVANPGEVTKLAGIVKSFQG